MLEWPRTMIQARGAVARSSSKAYPEAAISLYQQSTPASSVSHLSLPSPHSKTWLLFLLSLCAITVYTSVFWLMVSTAPTVQRRELRTKSLWIHAPKSALPSVYRSWRAQVMLKGSYVGRFEIASDHSAGNCTANGPGRWDSGGMVRFGVQIKDVEIAAYSAPIFRSVFLLWWLWLMSPTRRSRIKKYTREKNWIIFLEG